MNASLGALRGLLDAQERDVDAAVNVTELLCAKVASAEAVLMKILRNPHWTQSFGHLEERGHELVRRVSAEPSQPTPETVLTAPAQTVIPTPPDVQRVPIVGCATADAVFSRARGGSAGLIPRVKGSGYELGRPFEVQRAEKALLSARGSVDPPFCQPQPVNPASAAPCSAPRERTDASAQMPRAAAVSKSFASAFEAHAASPCDVASPGDRGKAEWQVEECADDPNTCSTDCVPVLKVSKGTISEVYVPSGVTDSEALLTAQNEVVAEEHAARAAVLDEVTVWQMRAVGAFHWCLERAEGEARQYIEDDEAEDRCIRVDLRCEERNVLLSHALRASSAWESDAVPASDDGLAASEPRPQSAEPSLPPAQPEVPQCPSPDASPKGNIAPEVAQSEMPVESKVPEDGDMLSFPDSKKEEPPVADPAPTECLVEETKQTKQREAHEAVLKFICCEVPLNPPSMVLEALDSGGWKRKTDKARDPPRPFFVHKETKTRVWNLCKHLVTEAQDRYRLGINATHLPRVHCKRCKVHYEGIPRHWRCTECQSNLYPKRAVQPDNPQPCALCNNTPQENVACQVCTAACCPTCTDAMPLPRLGYSEKRDRIVCRLCAAPVAPEPSQRPDSPHWA